MYWTSTSASRDSLAVGRLPRPARPFRIAHVACAHAPSLSTSRALYIRNASLDADSFQYVVLI